jgi:single-stranded DNA-binding protein
MAEFAGIECAFIGRLPADAELKTYGQDNRPMGALRVGVGEGENVQWVGVATFGANAHALVTGLTKGNRVYVEGRIKLEAWTGKDGVQRSGLKVAAWKVERLGEIGKNKPAAKKPEGATQPNGDSKPARGWQSPLEDDHIPFAPEMR